MGVSNTVTADTTLTPTTYKFCGATVTELGYLTGVTSAIQTQLNNLAPKASPTFTGTVTVPGLTSTGKLACGTNTVTCGALTCTTATLRSNTIATTNLIPSLTDYLKQATTLTPA